MPMLSPKKNESKDDFISRCISAEKSASPDRPNDQVAAMCYGQWNRSKVKHSKDVLTYDIHEELGFKKIRTTLNSVLPKGVTGLLEITVGGFVELQAFEFSKSDGWDDEKVLAWVSDSPLVRKD